MSYARIDELEEIAKRQGRSIGINSPASYFAAALEMEQIDDVGTVDTVKETRNTTDQKNTDRSNLATNEKEHQIDMPNKDEGTQKAFSAQGYFDMLATYNKIGLDLA